MVSFEIPTRIILPRKTKKGLSFPLNVNAFANQHHRIKHNAKMVFYEHIETLTLQPLPTPIRLHYKYYSEANREFDEANVGGGLDKFLCDALVHCGVIPDDSYRYVKHYTFEYMGVKKHEWDDTRLKGLAVVDVRKV